MIALARRDHRKSKFGLCHGIKLISNLALDLCNDEVRILIFDDPAEHERSQFTQFCSNQLYSTLPSATLVFNTRVLNLAMNLALRVQGQG